MVNNTNPHPEHDDSPATVDSVATQHRDKLIESHLALQKLATKYAIPVTMLAFIGLLLSDPCWHNAVLLVGFVLMSVAWVVALRLTQKGNLEKSVATFIWSVISFEALTMLVLNNNPASSLLACTIMVIYASLFTPRLLVAASVGTFLAFTASELVRWFQPWAAKECTPAECFFFEVGFVLLLLPLAAIVLRRSHKMKDYLVEQMSRMNYEQNRIIKTAADVSDTLEDVVMQLEEFSVSFAAQAAQQASAIAQTTVVMEQIRKIAGDTANSASATQNDAESTRYKSEQTSAQLKKVERGFGKVLGTTETARDEFATLASQAESIEEVLRVNRDIAAQIKILAVNAGIQAAKAGKWGVGFNVVARELKSMIQNTDKSLEDSRTLLESIQKRARHSADTINTSSDLLKGHARELNSTGAAIEEITNSFINAARQFSLISSSSKEQQTRLNEVSNGMNQIDISAGQLNKQTNILVESVRRISSSQASIKKILKEARV